MKKLYVLLVLFVCILSVQAQEVKLQFITINGYGNNLYIDNVTLGTQFNNDVGVVAINNIAADTSYALGTSPFIVAPEVSIINVGKQNVTSSFNVTMTVTPGGYTSTKSVSSLNSGQSTVVVFDNLTITPSQAVNITVTSSLSGDENTANNSLTQNTLYLPGTQRTVLLEEWTSSTCGPCAANNPTIDAFISSHFDSVVAIKYHMNWPAPGNDPMYAYNPQQANDRRFYYGVNAVPNVIMDGIVNPSYPYSTPSSLPGAFYPRKNVGTPVAVSVTDTRLAGDTIQADVTVQVLSPLSAGQYYLRVHAVERHIKYATPPGSNGETDFYDVFRKAYPNSLGTSVPTAAGTYNFTFKYPLDMATWVDSMMYTAVFIQNDVTKEVLNSAKARNHVLENFIVETNFNRTVEKPIPAPVSENIFQSQSMFNNTESLVGTFNYELFEGTFPAAGWKLVNPDGGLTFEQFEGANGTIIGGSKCITVGFYSYSTTGQKDTLTSLAYNYLLPTDSVKFNWAYAQYSASYVDRLIVRLSTDGGLTYPNVIFDKSGAQLATAPTTTASFIPANASQWGTFSFPLEGLIVPVELLSFSASTVDNTVTLNWSTATEVNNLGFEVQRKLNGEFITVGFIKGLGTTTEVQNYSFVDRDVQSGSYTYRLKQVDFDGSFSFSSEVNVDVTGPMVYSLKQNYPNPFNPETKIVFNLASESKVSLSIFNVLGEKITSLVNGQLAQGTHEVYFNGSNLNSGIYFYKLEATGIDGRNFTDVKKMTLLK